MKFIRLTPRADEDIDDCFGYLAAQSMSAAERFLESLHRATRQIADTPKMGTRVELRSKKRLELRRWGLGGFENYVVYYRPIEGGISIVRILHAARDRDAILEQGDV